MSKDSNNNTATADYGAGYLEISEKGFGFLRTAQNHFHPKPTDIFVTPDTIKRNFLREGSLVAGPSIEGRGQGQRHALRRLYQVGALREPDHY